jgi:hypothetical protein
MKLSELSWTMADYEAAAVEIPERIREFPEMCEADLMTSDEVEEFIKDSIATLRILSDKQSLRLDAASNSFKADMNVLLEFGRIEEDEYNGLTNDINLRF